MTKKELATAIEIIEQLVLTKKGQEMFDFIKTMLPNENDSKTIQKTKLTMIGPALTEMVENEGDQIELDDYCDAFLLKDADPSVFQNLEAETEEDEKKWDATFEVYRKRVEGISEKLFRILST